MPNMNSFRLPGNAHGHFFRRFLLIFLCSGSVLGLTVQASAASNVTLWDTGAPFSTEVNLEDRGSWRPVPTDMFTLEADPAKARSDPGYYGREYSFKGDAVVESPKLVAVFWSAKGRVIFYARPPAVAGSETAGTNVAL